ncbi:MAG: SCO family protein [Fimbriimonadaceae bacterium]|nr:SCO family protein [Fimbriimonadaceae bacterium]
MLRIAVLATALAVIPTLGFAQGEASRRSLAEGMAITQRIGDRIDTGAEFQNENGEKITLRSLLKDRPVLVFPVYFTCPSGCNTLVTNVMKTIARLNPEGRKNKIDFGITTDLIVGRDFDIVFLSINPTETSKDSSTKQMQVLRDLNMSANEAGWHFLTGDMANIRRVTESIGFKFRYEPTENILNHPTGSVMLTADGLISAYTVGNDLPTRVLESHLATAKAGELSPKVDQTRMFGCVRMSKSTTAARAVVEQGLRAVGFAFVIAMFSWIGFLSYKYRRPAAGGPVSPSVGGPRA